MDFELQTVQLIIMLAALQQHIELSFREIQVWASWHILHRKR